MLSSASAWVGGGFLLSELALAGWRRVAATNNAVDHDAGSLRRLWIVISLSITAGVILAAHRIPPLLPTGFPWSALGLYVFVAGVIVRWWAIKHLGRFFTVNVTVAADHRVVDTGPYRWVRHPSYSGLLLEFFGFGLTLGSVPSLAVVFIPSTLALMHRIKVEEFVLSAHLPDSYPAYVARTKRLVPFIL